ncbi:tetratricopeptide repeat protein, partial [Arcobacter sp. CECT 8985]|uniref:tetratricopeptide repeat protein n=1 Tax=Arcobacter sp. CECT 8985 TaxID=1935424 RepID=UPI001027ADF0
NILMNNLDFKKVLKNIKKSKKNSVKLEFNIFNNFIYGNNRIKSKKKYTYYETIKKLVDIENNLQKNPNSTMDNYLYATALYNLSYWGNSNILTTSYRSTYYFKEKANELKKINLSIKHFKKALKTAKNKEFKAKIIYMLAKSELALYDINSAKTVNYDFTKGYALKRAFYWDHQKVYNNFIVKGYGEYFNKLKQKYSDTSYYKQLLKECGNLNYYYKTSNTLDKLNKNIKNHKNKIALLKDIENDVKNKKTKELKEYNQLYIYTLLKDIPLTKKTLAYYNNIAYYLIMKRKNYEAIYLLEKIINKYPKRVVALYNLGDAYYSNYNYDKAREYYKKYIELMKKLNKENKIPKKVLLRVQSR